MVAQDPARLSKHLHA